MIIYVEGAMTVLISLFVSFKIKQLNVPAYFLEQGQHIHGRIDLRLAVQ